MATLRRTNYFDGLELGVAEFVADRSYLNTLRGLFNNGLNRWGIASGLDVTIGSDLRSVKVAAGLAINPAGQEIVVVADQSVRAPPLSSQSVDLFLTVRTARSDLSQASFATGYKRIEHVPQLAFVAYGKSVDPMAVFLATAVLDGNGQFSALQLDARRYCGFDLGKLTFLQPQDGSPGASLSAVPKEDTAVLSVQADELRFDGLVQMAGGLTVGRQFPRATLDVQSGATALAAFSNADGAPLLTVGQDRQTSIGVPMATSRLTVAGDIAMDGSRRIGFDNAGGLQSGSSLHAVNLSSAGSPMSFMEAGKIDIVSGATGGQGNGDVPTLSIVANGNVGIGEPNPGETLTVNGPVQSLNGGFSFPGGAMQSTAANSTTVRIGGIVDWWPGGCFGAPPPQFVICNGQVINEPKSPLNGRAAPNLVGLFVRGTTDYSSIGQTGGSPSHDHTLSALPVHTHSISHSHNAVSTHTEKDDGPGDSDTVDDKCSDTDHVHPISIALELCDQNESQSNDSVIDVLTASAANAPQSMGMLKIMRIY